MDKLKEASNEQKKHGWYYNCNQIIDIKNQVRVLHGVVVTEDVVDCIVDTLVKLKYVTLTRENIPS